MSVKLAQTNQPEQRRYKPAQTKALILEAARDLFSTQGYAKTSSFEIAQRAGVAEGSVFYHFGSKTNLLSALGAAYAEEKVDAMQRGETDLSRLEPGILIARAFDHVRRHGSAVSPTGLPLKSAEIQPFLNGGRKVVVDFIARCIKASRTHCGGQAMTDEAAEVIASFSYAVVSDAIHRVFESDTNADETLVLAEAIRFVRAAGGYGHLTGIPAVETPLEIHTQ